MPRRLVIFLPSVLTAPRRASKTVLLRHLFPGASYHLFEDPSDGGSMQPLAGAWRKRPTRVGEWRVAGKCQVSQNSNYKLSDYRAIPHFLIFDSADKGWPPRSQALKVLQLRPQHLLVKEMIALKA